MQVALIARRVGSENSLREKPQLPTVIVLPPMYPMPSSTPYIRSLKVGE